MSERPYNPLEIEHLGESIERRILSSTPTPMTDIASFNGAGVYAIYYTGDLPIYSLIADRNREGQFRQPIYVGKAIPEGGRKGLVVTSSDATKSLSSRLRSHRKSILAAENLDVADFHCRWLVVESIWIPLGESILINRFAPVWNQVVDGFGSNAAGSGRFAGQRSRWDTLHPGRAHAANLAVRRETAEDITRDVEEYLRQRLQV
ncbi:Eco29kI family restriction endonuclease [Georgenia yuyongxinii]|uniref:Eco29kI family restriction endonuclease n=1 Tax=Georgenia yuyongxinii TaxID=2589797 RepID=A0A5B8C0X8_9MICO|nr:Eco29kI family restriction endonuclease [Georgenia yuyongxinii]QDC24088.1 Eco29kI family restriction endonuclease [Georgenia yuyongxinii]